MDITQFIVGGKQRSSAPIKKGGAPTLDNKQVLEQVSLDVGDCIINYGECGCATPETKAIIAEEASKVKPDKPVPQKTCSESLNILMYVYNCDSEKCVLQRLQHNTNSDRTAIKESLDNFKPNGPIHKPEWLSNTHIDDVLKSFAKQYPEFKYYPTGLMNLQDSLGRIDLEKDFNEGYETVACVVNTTRKCPVSGPCGDHWVCVVMKKEKDNVISMEYFNSSGNTPPNDILTVFKQQKQLVGGKCACTEKYNSVVHQRGDSECGVYCLYYIRSRLEGVDAERFYQSRISDEAMIMFRRYIFSEQ